MADSIEDLKVLAGITNNGARLTEYSNISITGTEKAQIQREQNIKPGTKEWFKLWFAKPYLTGEKPN